MQRDPANTNTAPKPDDTVQGSDGLAGDDRLGAERGTAPDEASIQDWIEADRSRPTLPEETADGLDDTDEEIRHQAEDLPVDTPWRTQ